MIPTKGLRAVLTQNSQNLRQEVFLAYVTHNDMSLVVVLFDEAEGKSAEDATKTVRL